MLFFRGTRIFAIRHTPYKAHFRTRNGFGLNFDETVHEPPLLFNVEHDPGEQFDIGADHPKVVSRLVVLAERFREQIEHCADQLATQMTDER
jgi:hypothetical protein